LRIGLNIVEETRLNHSIVDLFTKQFTTTLSTTNTSIEKYGEVHSTLLTSINNT
jgi:hypothetical protein